MTTDSNLALLSCSRMYLVQRHRGFVAFLEPVTLSLSLSLSLGCECATAFKGAPFIHRLLGAKILPRHNETRAAAVAAVNPSGGASGKRQAAGPRGEFMVFAAGRSSVVFTKSKRERERERERERGQGSPERGQPADHLPKCQSPPFPFLLRHRGRLMSNFQSGEK